MKELLVEFLSQLLNEERKFKAVKVTDGEERVSAFSSQANADAAVQAGTHRKYNPQKDKNLPGAEDDKASIPPRAGDASWPGVDEPAKSVKKKQVPRTKAAAKMSRTRRPSKATASDIDVASQIYPDAQNVSVIDTISDDEITKVMRELNIPTGEGEALPADMEKMQKDYAKRGLDGHYGDTSYYKRMKEAGRTVRNPKFKIPGTMAKKLRARGFPERYIQLLERAMNVQADGEEPKFSDMIEGVGAGKNASQFGEVMSMAMIAMPPELRNEFRDMMVQEIQKSKMNFLKQQLTPAQFNQLQKDPRALKKALSSIGPVGDSDWVEAAVDHADAFDSYMNSIYGKGNWRLEATAWDRKQDIIDMGLDYKNKGFSTDALFRVQPLTKRGTNAGPAQVIRASLKKDENVMLFNGGVGEIENLVRTSYLPPRQKKLYKILTQMYSLLDAKKDVEQRNTVLTAFKKLLGIDGDISYEKARQLIKDRLQSIDAEAREVASKQSPQVVSVLDRVRTFTEDQKKNGLAMAKSVATNSKLPTSKNAAGRKELEAASLAAAEKHKGRQWKSADMLKAYEIVKGCATAKEFDTCVAEELGSSGADRIAKCCTLATAIAAELNAGTEYTKKLEAHVALATDLGNDYMGLFSRDNPEMLASLMGVLKEKFPMSVVMGGDEMMLIDGVNVGTSTLQTVFGVDSYDKLGQNLKLMEVDGQIMLAYVGEGNRTVMIGAVDCRQKGIGYASVGFEIKCSNAFVLACAQANKENGTESGSNERAINRITKARTNQEAKAAKAKESK